MDLEFKKVKKIDINIEHMAYSFAANIDNINSFKKFLLEHISHKIKDADGYDNWNDIRVVVYNSLYVYCAERDYNNILEKLKQIKYN